MGIASVASVITVGEVKVVARSGCQAGIGPPKLK